jgi:hypothetical protein
MLSRTRALLALALAAALGAAVFGVWSSSAATGPGVIRITSTQTKFVRVDVGARGRSAGDAEVIRGRVYNRRIRARAIGRYEMVCTFTFGYSRACRGTFFLPRGKIVVGGGITQRQIYELAILGGTGLYDNARGTFTGTRTARNPRREFLIFRLTG